MQIITSKRIEIEHNKSVGGKSSERIRNKRLRGSTSLSAVTAALRDEDSDGDLELEESMEEEIQSVCIHIVIILAIRMINLFSRIVITWILTILNGNYSKLLDR